MGLSDVIKKVSRVGDYGFSVSRRIVAQIARHEESCGRGLRAFEEAVVVLIGGESERELRIDAEQMRFQTR